MESCFIIALDAFIRESMWATAASESAFCLATLSAEPVQAPKKRQGIAIKKSLVFISQLFCIAKIPTTKALEMDVKKTY
jgi:hypothetical protein